VAPPANWEQRRTSCLAAAISDDILPLNFRRVATGAQTIPCEGAAGHEDAHTTAITALADNDCTSVTVCPDGSECAEAVETLADYYTRCSIVHDAEDALFQQMETADGPCMVHADEVSHYP
jgi:hypothetical protein